MPVEYYIDSDDVRDKLGNTIKANYTDNTIDNSIAYGCDNTDALTHIDWAEGMKYFGLAKGIAIDFAAAFCHATQINVSIQQLREWQMAVDDCKSLFQTLKDVGLIAPGTQFFVADQFESNVLNPTSGSYVTGLRGIMPNRRSLFGTDFFYTP